MDGVLVVSTFECNMPSSNEHCEVEVYLNHESYAPGEEIIATIRLNVAQTMVDVLAISWQLFGAEMLERKEGYLSRHVIIDQEEYLVGSAEELEKESGPDVEERTHIFEPDPYLWEARVTLPENAPPTFRTSGSRIEYFFSVTVHLKLGGTLERKILVPVASDFPDSFTLDEKLEQVAVGEIPASGLMGRFRAPSKLMIVARTERYHYCPWGMINPVVPVHLTISSLCDEIIDKLDCEYTRRTVLHHKDHDVTESATVCKATLPLIPPLTASVTYVPLLSLTPIRLIDQCG